MRLRQTLRWTLIVILIAPLGYCTSIGALNYSGFCFERTYDLLPRGRYLSDDERVRDGIAGVLGHYPFIRFVPEEMPSAGKPAPSQDKRFRASNAKGLEITEDQLILYRDAEEFVALNPGCCNFDRRGLYGEVGESDLWTKVTGYSAGFFNAKYQIRYRDSKDQIRSRWSGTTFHMTNCGHGNRYY